MLVLLIWDANGSHFSPVRFKVVPIGSYVLSSSETISRLNVSCRLNCYIPLTRLRFIAKPIPTRPCGTYLSMNLHGDFQILHIEKKCKWIRCNDTKRKSMLNEISLITANATCQVQIQMSMLRYFLQALFNGFLTCFTSVRESLILAALNT